MSDGSLSQEEIDALLAGAEDLGTSFEAAEGPGGLAEDEQSQLRSLSTDLAQSMAVTLSTITGKSVTIGNPRVEAMSRDALVSQISGNTVQIVADFSEGVSGKHSFIISEQAAKQVAALMMVQDEGELTEMSLSAITEGFNQMTGAALNVLEERLGSPVRMAPLTASMREDPVDLEMPGGSFIRIQFDFVSNGTSSIIDEIYDIQAVKSLTEAAAGKKGAAVQQPAPSFAKSGKSFQPGGQMTMPLYNAGPAPGFGQGPVGVQPVQFAPLSTGEQAGVTGNIGLLMDVSMQLTVELGRTKMLIKDILGMGEGTIVELDKLAGEPVDLLVNGKLIAKGEVVVIDENFGVRVTDIISPMERISNLE
jgi:flagellar motor switch protein FliN/FliY